MKTIIIYSSKYGCTADCANYVKAGLPGSVTIENIDRAAFHTDALSNYDTIILGSSIYIGAISKKMKKLCHECTDLLSKKRLGIFVCCGFPEKSNEYFTANFPPELLNSAIAVHEFGGEARTSHMKFLDKSIMKAVTKGNYEKLKVSQDNMNHFIEVLNM